MALQENSQMQGFARHLVDRKRIRALKARNPGLAHLQRARIPDPAASDERRT